jgi:hypothetical protein
MADAAWIVNWLCLVVLFGGIVVLDREIDQVQDAQHANATLREKQAADIRRLLDNDVAELEAIKRLEGRLP